jgi:hypothetical protein
MSNNIMTRSTNTINSGDDIQSFAPDPLKCLGQKAAGTVFMAGPGGTVDISQWLGICLYPIANGQVAFNGNATQIMPVYAGRENVIIIHPNVTQIVASVDAIICGM